MERLKDCQICVYQWFIPFGGVVAVYVGLPCELSSLSLSLTNQCNVIAYKNDVVSGLICRNYNIFVVNNGHDFYDITIFEYRCCFCVRWPFEFSGSKLNDLTALTHSESVSTFYFSGTYKVRNEIETKRNETKSTKTKRNRLIWRKWKEKNKRQNEINKKEKKKR